MPRSAVLVRLSKCLAAGCIALVLAGSTAFGANAAASAEGPRRTRLTGAPEIDPGLAAAGLVVLLGGTLVLTGRRRPATR